MQDLPYSFDRLGIDSQTIFGMPPVEHIKIASALGCGHVSLGPMPVPWQLDRFAPWSLRDDLPLRRETRAALRDTGVALALAEGFTIRPQTTSHERIADFDLMAELGAHAAGAVSMEPDVSRALDQMASLAELAAERDLAFLFEFAPPHTFPTLATAAAALKSIGAPNARLLIDAMHLFRTGGTIADLVTLDPSLIGYIQLCDAPLEVAAGADYYQEACFERLRPGEGDLPLIEFLGRLPPGLRLGLEVPMQAELIAAENVMLPLQRIVEAARQLLRKTAAAADADLSARRQNERNTRDA